MSRVPWTRYDGGDVEAFAAMCICRERPTARRIRPSRGDGGIDIYVPLGDNRVEVYQVKKFAENLAAGQKTQIEESYARIKEYAEKRGWTIEAWHLTLPLDATKENDEWFDELTERDAFDATWQGLAVFDNWAADFPQVVDYYLEGDRARMHEDMERFAATTSIMLPGVDNTAAKNTFSILEPVHVLDRIALLRDALNGKDPHYMYDIIVSGAPAPPPLVGDGYPAHVASVSRPIKDQVVTVHILARCAESLYERPITSTGTVVVDKDSPEEHEWRKFLDYGRVPSRRLKVKDIFMDLPGGLGETTGEGLLLIRDLENPDAEYDRDLSVLGPDGNLVAKVPIHFSGPTSNHDGTGWSTRGVDKSGILTVEILSKLRESGAEMTFNFTLGDATGHSVADVAPVLAFMHHFSTPNTLRIADPRIPRRTHDRPIPTTKPRNSETRAAASMHHYVEALATTQQYADTLIHVPDPVSVSAHEAAETIRTGRLLREGSLTVDWDTLSVTLHKGVEVPDGASAMVTDVSLDATVGGTIIPLGTVRTCFEAGRVASHSTDSNGTTTVTFVPALGKTTAQLMWAGPDSINDEL
ncbi:hypothetical protein M1C57_20865 [Rhodococcus pyridinivorans]|uniref:hypothetical protein n=1 Tax=Rhodococcus pyridinivorans TaxID=103816 RepID=UPI00200AC392|nr:hypothetical protein [Rhodococcus pyridinivorans]UPW04043.1 hypothetical protein M1C57_20865 [Rhodococcus pyridinivorans]